MPNDLSKETSPYLLQHANNPVNWLAWNEESLQLAREQNKPILLSIGYSACHWCHVMAHESFEDEAVAKLMNSLFINIKVDREERPDIDKIYQAAHQLVARAPGGWPLTVFLTPDEQVPIFTGTYFPRELFKKVLARVEDYFQMHASKVSAQGEALRNALRHLDQSIKAENSSDLTLAPLETAKERLEASFDEDYGGFGKAPKFPHSTHIELLLMAWRRTIEEQEPDLQSLYMATLTLTRMAQGGLYDHLAGGFFRYSVDHRWAIPHFEKMLYDNAALISVYVDAHAATGEPFFGLIASNTADWIVQDMQSPAGGYYATLDADSEGEEGKYYLWTPAEIEAALDADEFTVSSEYFGLTQAPNFDGKAWHLLINTSLENLSQDLTKHKAQQKLDSARRKLLAFREERVAPSRDEKVLAGWNGLMIKAMARAACHLDRDDLEVSATRAVDFIHSKLWKDGRLLASHKDGRSRFPAYLDDHAFLAEGLIELLRYRWRSSDLVWACQLADVLLEQFEDPGGGFFFTAHDHETLIHRPKPLSDESTPSGNGIAVRVLLWLGYLLGEHRYLVAAERALKAAWPVIEQYPEAHSSLLQALELALAPPEIVVIRGQVASVMKQWQRCVNAGFHPNRMSITIPNDEDALPGFLAQRQPRNDIVAYVCKGRKCLEPITQFRELTSVLASVATHPAPAKRPISKKRKKAPAKHKTALPGKLT